ncbi:unnamed protein product [Urochloa decumbens]|uniref:YTH domain-containing family protein n=1 Tax=Urochloa decumbens TaxID=240449 RepID=A0ABC9GU84_9POAL
MDDLVEHHDLIFGEEFCFPASTTCYSPFYGMCVPGQLYQHQTISACKDGAPNYMGHQAQGIPCVYYVVNEYGIAHSPHGPHALPPCAIGDDKTAQSLTNRNGLFVPGGIQQTVAVASESGVAWNQYAQQATISSMDFHGHTFLPKEQPHRPAPWKRQISGGAMVPARLPHAQQASQRSPQVAIPSVRTSVLTNLSYNTEVPGVGSDHCKTLSSERSQTYARTGSYSNRRLSSEIIVKSYTSRLHVDNPEGNIVIRTDEYNRDDFQLNYSSAKFFVIKPINEADVHKSIKYGVWSTSSTGNDKLDSAFREAQMIAASSSTLCPVFLFFSVNGSNHFCGVAEMVGPVNIQKDMDFWSKNIGIGSFPVKWRIIKDIPSMMLQNNGDKPVTSKEPQEIDRVHGNIMLQLFKFTRAEKCLLDRFKIHDEEEFTNLQRRPKLRRGAQHFVHSRPAKTTPKSVLIYRPIKKMGNLNSELQNLDLDGHEGQTSTMKPALEGEQQYCRKVKITPGGEIHSGVDCVSTKPSVELTNEGQKVPGKLCPSTNSESRETQPTHLAPFISIGSMWVPLATSD